MERPAVKFMANRQAMAAMNQTHPSDSERLRPA